MEVQTLHKTLENETQINKEKHKEMKKNYDPTSEKIWDLSDSQGDNIIGKNLYEDWI